MFPSISFPLGSIGSFNAGALRSTVVTRFNATTAPSDSCPNIRPGRSPKFLCRTIRTRHPTLPRHAPPFRCTILVQGRVLASCHLKHWPHGTCVTRLYPWIHFRYGSYICEREASPCRSPFTMPASLLMQWSIHKANTFQFASSAKLRLAHRKTQKCTKSCSGASLIGGNARSSPPPRPFQLLGVLGELGVGRFHAKGAKPAKGSLGRSPFCGFSWQFPVARHRLRV